MLSFIPKIHSTKGMKSFFANIDTRLTLYEDLKDTPALLELAIWKSKIIERLHRTDILLTTEMKMRCRTESIAVVNIINIARVINCVINSFAATVRTQLSLLILYYPNSLCQSK